MITLGKSVISSGSTTSPVTNHYSSTLQNITHLNIEKLHCYGVHFAKCYHSDKKCRIIEETKSILTQDAPGKNPTRDTTVFGPQRLAFSNASLYIYIVICLEAKRCLFLQENLQAIQEKKSAVCVTLTYIVNPFLCVNTHSRIRWCCCATTSRSDPCRRWRRRRRNRRWRAPRRWRPQRCWRWCRSKPCAAYC